MVVPEDGETGTSGSCYNETYNTWAGQGATQTAGGARGVSGMTNYMGIAGEFGLGGNSGNKASSTSYYSSGAGGRRLVRWRRSRKLSISIFHGT